MQNTEVLHSMQELFTISTTGESAVSIRGLSRLSGIPKSTLISWFKSDLTGDGVPEPLKALQDKALYLDGNFKVRGKSIKPIRSDVAVCIIEYAAFVLGVKDAQENYVEVCHKLGLTVNKDLVQMVKCRRPNSKRTVPCFVYMIQDSASKACKIGVSNDPIARLATLQTGFPYDLNLLWAVPGSFQEEKALHNALDDFHLRGEWFDPIVFSLVNPNQIKVN
ncbi:MAG: GIY-YIG nuclease family protein [Microcoleus sp.]